MSRCYAYIVFKIHIYTDTGQQRARIDIWQSNSIFSLEFYLAKLRVQVHSASAYRKLPTEWDDVEIVHIE